MELVAIFNEPTEYLFLVKKKENPYKKTIQLLFGSYRQWDAAKPYCLLPFLLTKHCDFFWVQPQYTYRRGWMEDQVCALVQHTAHLITVKGVNFICLRDINIMFFHAFSAV